MMMMMMMIIIIIIIIILMFDKGGIAPNQVIARSEFEVHCQIVTE